MATLTHKRHYRVTLDLEIIDDSHPRDFNWANMLEISCDEGVSLVDVEELDDSHMW